ncbi:uncharacterized protein [Littorina saxatilis]|uniref:uncharacterized protein isoform X1 n=1 Tax=Littorina saxatilis TaxID=31220 RepID=UPI0038B4A72E
MFIVYVCFRTYFSGDKPKNDVTDNTLVNDASQTTSVNAASETVCISVGVSLGLALLLVTAILGVVFCRKSRACAPRSARQSPANAVTFRPVPAREQQDRGVVVSDESHHAYIEVIDDSGEPGASATGKTSSHEAADSESDGYLQPYTSPMSGVSGHCYSSLATRRTKPDDYLNPIQPASESRAAARTTHSDSPYEIA